MFISVNPSSVVGREGPGGHVRVFTNVPPLPFRRPPMEKKAEEFSNYWPMEKRPKNSLIIGRLKRISDVRVRARKLTSVLVRHCLFGSAAPNFDSTYSPHRQR